MNEQFSVSHSQLDKAMNPEQFDQIVEAIISGKYSWACVLILRFAGYNPLHYIPYRTYNRLIKNNRQLNSEKTRKALDCLNKPLEKSKKLSSGNSARHINDLVYKEVINQGGVHITGGNRCYWDWDIFLELN